MLVSVIIPLRKDQGYLKACVAACFRQTGFEVEVLVLPDHHLPAVDPRVQVIPTGPISPARKRNRGAALAHGDILAFIDDDTKPLAGWLNSAIPHFDNPKVAAVGGPAITPSSDPFWAQVGGAVYESWLMSGPERRRYLPTRPAWVEDYPSCNLLVRRSIYMRIDGFRTDFWPGEDTEFCLTLIQAGYRIYYEPKAIIEHHRRSSLPRHFNQLSQYALHRGYFVKRYPQTSRKIIYFLPSLSVVTGTLLLLGFTAGSLLCGKIGMALFLIYLILSCLSLLHKPLWMLPASILMLLSHSLYGTSFLKGLFARQLPEEKKS